MVMIVVCVVMKEGLGIKLRLLRLRVVMIGDDRARHVAHLDLLPVASLLPLAAPVHDTDDDEDERDEADDDAEDDVQQTAVGILVRAALVLVRRVAPPTVVVAVTDERRRDAQLRRLAQEALLLITESLRV